MSDRTRSDREPAAGRPRPSATSPSGRRVAEAPKPHSGWWHSPSPSVLLGVRDVLGITYLVIAGIGVWGNTSTVGWAWDITNFVWWIGIGHAGTLISAVLFLTRQQWRRASTAPPRR